MKKRNALLWAALFAAHLGLQADDIVVDLKITGTQTLKTPFMVDSLDVNGKKYSGDSTLTTAQFSVENNRYVQAILNMKGVQHYQLYVDGALTPGEGTHTLTLLPMTHHIEVKYGGMVKPTVSLHTDAQGVLTQPASERLYTLHDVLYNTRVGGASLSPDGKYLITTYRTTYEDGKRLVRYRLTERATGRIITETDTPIRWMPRTNRYLEESKSQKGRTLMAVDPATGDRRVVVGTLPEGDYVMSPTEDFLVYTITTNGPEERKDVFEVIDPDDRQPGWRNRTSLSLYDIKSSNMQPLTFGHRNVWLYDLSADGHKALIGVDRRRLEQRPTTLTSVYVLDLRTLKADEIVKDDGFVGNAVFSPDGSSILVSGSPESFGGVGKNVKDGQIPSMFDYQLYLVNVSSHKVTPLTRDFNPSVNQFRWSKNDGLVYFTAEHRDSVCLYRMDVNSSKISRIAVKEDLVEGFGLASAAHVMAWWGQSASNSDRLYVLDTKTTRSVVVDDLSAQTLKDVVLGDCKPWTYRNSRGDIITARYYLPPHFNTSCKYPMIVNYYGGCSPISRTLESRYAPHAYAALGYVVLVLEPSGCTGFGQEFSARHVNAYGDYTADDIIEGTRRFCEEHGWVNAKKVGCIGASYGGFMTQYLQTKTDIFAAAVSHAGISDITGYWGYGYWGYSYNETAAAGSYPWSDRELYVDHSPLYNADKIHTPILFLHGTADHNVPTSQSVAIYTALKLLGRPTALIEVEGQDHQILDEAKRIRWEHSIYAWFAKWLQDDDTWWNAMYPKKTL